MFVNTEQQLISLLFKKRVEYVAADELAFYYAARKSDLHNKVRYQASLNTRQVRLGLSRHFIASKHAGFTTELNDVVRHLSESGFADEAMVHNLLLGQFENDDD